VRWLELAQAILAKPSSVSAIRHVLHRHWPLIAILLVGISVRLVEFGSVPNGLNQDEASTGYDAFALLHHGIDRNGFHNPVMFVSWGSGTYALPGYLAMPLYLLFGVSATSLRGVNLMAGIASLPVFYALVRRTGDRTLALVATFLLAISPWHIMISRWALDSNLLPALFLLGVFFLARASSGGTSALLAGAFFALTLWAYGTAYVVTPLFLASAALTLAWNKPRRWRSVAQGSAIFAVLALPIVLFVVINQLHLRSIRAPVLSIPRLTGVPRYQTMSTVLSGDGFAQVRENLHTLWHLLVTGDDGLIWNAVPGAGYLYVFGLPLALLGVLTVVTRTSWWRSTVEFFFIAWLVASVLLAVFFLDLVNVNRINIIFLPLIFFAAVGIRTIASSQKMLVLVIGAHCLLFAQFLHLYFGSYRAAEARAFSASFGAAVDAAADSTTGQLCITDLVPEPYIFVLFYRRIDPHVFLKSVRYVNPGAEFQDVSAFDRYTFGLRRCNARSISAYVADKEEERLIDHSRFSIQHVGRYVVALRRPS
jgi:hypothetical protein